MRWSEKQKSEYVRTVEVVSEIEEILAQLFGLIQLETGNLTRRDGMTRVDYVLNVADFEDARVLARELQYRHVSAGVRPESGHYVLRISKNDLMEAFVHAKEYSYQGKSVEQLFGERLALHKRRGPDHGFLPAPAAGGMGF